ncbi:MAG: hypothetical protein JSV91_14730 [Phycisphaerales bacterium]|nr:MAG: hypothetical protein JSV91_14730 [Phycisphaerales bacterium]
MKKTLVSCCLLVSLTGAGTADAGILFYVEEVGSDVEMTVTGSLDLDATFGYQGVASNTTPFFWPAGALMTNGDQQSDYYAVGSWTGVFGSGDFQTWDVTSGDRVAMFSDPAIGVPIGYMSGDPLSGSSTKFNATFASLGMIPGVYVNTLVNGNAVDTVTIQIVPAPGALAFFGIAGLATRRRRR